MSMEFFVARPPTNNTTNRIVDRTSCERIMNTRDLILTRYVSRSSGYRAVRRSEQGASTVHSREAQGKGTLIFREHYY